MAATLHPRKKFLIADDHPLILTALGTLLNILYVNPLIEELKDGKELLERLAASHYDLVITDIHMPDCDIFELITAITLNHSGTPILIYSMCAENIYGLRVLKAGAMGFISKVAPAAEVEKAIELALSGQVYLSPALNELISERGFKRSETPFSALSTRELQVAALLLSGNSVTQISNFLNIETSTTGTHKGHIFQKLGIASLFELKDLSVLYSFSHPSVL